MHHLSFHCIICRRQLPNFAISLKSPQICCNIPYYLEANFLKFPFESLLLEKYKQAFLLNQTLNNNAYVAYHTLTSSSLSQAIRQDVQNFREFIEKHISRGVLCDIGCGILSVPGYLDFSVKDNYAFIGIDPIDDKSFKGVRIVGCSEMIPLANQSCDAAVFATSLDHVCSLDDTVKEVHRILKDDGKVLIWMGDRSENWVKKKLKWVREFWFSWKKGYNTRRYRVYPNGAVFYIPRGAVDPFHSYAETPKKTIRLFQRYGFKLVDLQTHSTDENFLAFVKKDSECCDG